jgi:hypothetical protein
MDVHELLAQAVETAAPRLAAMTDDESRRPRSADAWSPREIVGHLVDSACNNHARFVCAQLGDDLVFPGYDQEAWVDAQRYDEAPWTDLVALWRAYNLHLARVVAAMPSEALTRPRARHNLDEIAWRAVPRTEPATLEYFVRDYVGHLENHLRQILPDYEPRSFDAA